MRAQTATEANFEARKLACLADQYALTVDALIEEYVRDDVVPGICMNPECEYATDVAPDEREGWCGACGTHSVRSGLVLAGIP